MKYLNLILLAFVISLSLNGQVAPDKYWVRFTDKNNSPYSVDEPLEFLSQRAIDRRIAHDIDITESDLPVNPSYLQGVKDAGATLLNRSKWFNSVTIHTTSQSVIDAVNALPYVESVVKASEPFPPNSRFSVKEFFRNETYGNKVLPAQKNGNVTGSYDYGQGYNQISMLNGDVLHDQGYDGEGMIIAVLDAGFLNADNMAAFDSIWDNGQVLGYKDFVDPQNPNIFDSHFHGSAVLSTMAANLPGQMVGTAPKASYWFLRTEDGGSENIIEELNWVSGAEFADSAGADIINSSLGYTTFDDPAVSHTYADMDGNTTPITIGADLAISRGMIAVNSAGNYGGSSWQYIGAPADGDSVFSIGAVDPNGNYAGFSSTGPTYDGRLKPNVMAQGQDAVYVSPSSGNVNSGNGTSFSSPIMAGLVACLWQANPSARNTDILQAIMESGSLYSNPNNEMGNGIPDFEMANSLLTVIGSGPALSSYFTVLPNPFTDRITLSAPGEKHIIEARVYDLAGRLVAEYEVPGNNKGELEISGLDNLKDGVYMFTIQTADGRFSRKVLKR